ncbi:MAG: SCO family protein [Deltaproteobacteria bacterium]|nr:MAG: SCO family protein [Deltaproteobacteria bacterium]
MTGRVFRSMSLAVLFLASIAWTPAAWAHDPKRHAPPAAAPPASAKPPGDAGPKTPLRLDEGEQRRYFTDTELVDQDGRKLRFYTDVLKGRLVLISFIYTSCTDICPILMHNLGDVQELLGDAFGKDVFFVSISVDPEDDTPKELKAYGERYDAKPGWTFLTGGKGNVDRVIKRFGEWKEDFEDHSMIFLLGDVKNARWSKMRGDSPPEVVAVRLRDLLERR